MHRAFFLLACAWALAACGVLEPYRIDIQQGNYLSQEMVTRLKLGMTKEQARFVLGTPLVIDIFHAERWDYVYSFDRRGHPREERRLVVHFEDSKVARVSTTNWWIPVQ